MVRVPRSRQEGIFSPRGVVRHRHLTSFRAGLLSFLQESGVNTSSPKQQSQNNAPSLVAIGYLSDSNSRDNYLRVGHTSSLRTSIPSCQRGGSEPGGSTAGIE